LSDLADDLASALNGVLADPSLSVSVGVTQVLAAARAPRGGGTNEFTLSGDATFKISINGCQPQEVLLSADATNGMDGTEGNTSLQDLVDDLNDAIAATPGLLDDVDNPIVTAQASEGLLVLVPADPADQLLLEYATGDPTRELGFDRVQESAEVLSLGLETGQQLTVTFFVSDIIAEAGGGRVSLTARSIQVPVQALIADQEPAGAGVSKFVLSGDATFKIIVNEDPAQEVTLSAADTSDNTSLQNLVDDLNAALINAELEEMLKARESSDGRLELFTLNPDDTLKIEFDTVVVSTDSDFEPDDEVQILSLGAAVAGNFTLTFGGQTTDAIPFNAGADEVQAALESLTTIGAGNVAVTQSGGTYRMTFINDLGGQDVDGLTLDDSKLVIVPPGSVGISTAVNGFSVNEEQTITVNPTSGTFTLTFEDETTAPIDAGSAQLLDDIRSALQSLPSIGSGNVAVSQNVNIFTVTFQGALAGTNVEQLVATTPTEELGFTNEQVSDETTPRIVDRRLEIGAAAGLVYDDPAYQELGLLSSPVPFNGVLSGDAVFTLAGRDTSGDFEHVITVTGTDNNQTIDDLVDDINGAINIAFNGDEASPAPVQAFRVTADGNRIGFRGEGGVVTRLALREPNTVAEKELGFDPESDTTQRAKATEFFVEDATLTGNFVLDASELEATGNYGFLGVTAASTTDGLSTNTVIGQADLTLKDPDSGGSRVIVTTLSEKLAAGEFDQIVDASVTGEVDVALELTPEADFADPVTMNLDLIIADWLNNPPSLQPSTEEGESPENPVQVTISGTDSDDVRVFEEFGDTSFSTLTDGFGSIVDFLGGLQDSIPFLDVELPLVNRSVADLIDLAAPFADFVDAVAGNTVQTITGFEKVLKDQLGFGSDIDLDLDKLQALTAENEPSGSGENKWQLGNDATFTVAVNPGTMNEILPTVITVAKADTDDNKDVGDLVGDLNAAIDNTQLGGIVQARRTLSGKLELYPLNGSDELKITFDPSNPASNAAAELGFTSDQTSGDVSALMLDLSLGFEPTLLSLPVDLDLQQLVDLIGGISPFPDTFGDLGELKNLVGAGAEGTLELKLKVDLDLKLGLELTGTATPFLIKGDDGTKLTLGASLGSEDLDMSLNIGPFAILVEDGTAELAGEFGVNLAEGSSEVQKITVNTTSGNYTLTLNGKTTDAIAYNASADDLKSALEGLESIGSVEVETDVDGKAASGGDPAVNEVQKVTVKAPAGSTFKLKFDGKKTDPIEAGATAEDVQAALVALSSIGKDSADSDNVYVVKSGEVYTIIFENDLGGKDVDQLVADGPDNVEVKKKGKVYTVTFQNGLAEKNIDPLIPSITEVQVETTRQGVTPRKANEVQTVTVDSGTTEFTLTFDGKETEEIAAGADVETVKAALQALENIKSVKVETVTEGKPASGSDPAVDEVRTVTINASEGTFTLSFKGQSTGALEVGADAEDVQEALVALSSIGKDSADNDNVKVTKSFDVYTITFQNDLSGMDITEDLVAEGPDNLKVEEVTDGYRIEFINGLAASNVAQLEARAGVTVVTTVAGVAVDRFLLNRFPGLADIDWSLDGSAKLDLPLYLNDTDNPIGGENENSLVVEVTSLKDFLEGDFGSVTLETPNFFGFFTELPGIFDILRNPVVVVDGLDSLLQTIQDALNGQVLGISLPLIGDALSPAAQVVEGFRNDLLRPLGEKLRQFGDPIAEFQKLLFDVFGPQYLGGLGLLLDSEGNPSANIDDIQLTGFDPDVNPDAEFLQFDFSIGQTFVYDQDIAFELGLSAIGLDLDAGIELEISWSLDFGFGVDINDGFYFVTGHEGEDLDNDGIPDKELALRAMVSLKGTEPGEDATAKGTLGFLVVDVVDGVVVDQATGDKEYTRLFVDLGIDLKDPSEINEVQTVTVNADKGKFYLKYGEAQKELNFDASANAVRTALEDLNSDLKDNVAVKKREVSDSKMVYKITFVNDLAGQDISQLVAKSISLGLGDKSGTVEVETTVDGQDNPNNDGRLTFSEMRSASFRDILEPSVQGGADLRLDTEVNFSGLGLDAAVLPSIHTDIFLDWDIAASLTGGIEFGAPEVSFKDIELDLGSFITDFAGPILEQIGEIIEPLEWLLGPDGLLLRRLPVISDLAGSTITIRSLAEQLDKSAKIGPLLDAIQEIYFLVDLVTDAAAEANQTGGNIVLSFGDLDLNSLLGDGEDLRSMSNLKDLGAPEKATGTKPGAKTSADDLKPGKAKNFTKAVTRGEGSLDIAILKPENVFGLLLGHDDVTFVTYDLPPLEFSFDFRQAFPIYGPLVATLAGSFTAGVDLGFGYDSLGLSQFRDTGNPLNLINGFFISDVDFQTGEDINEAYLMGEIAAGAGLSFGIASVGVEGGISATIDFNLNDPNRDGKVRIDEILGNIVANATSSNPMLVALSPIAFFDVSGLFQAFLRAYLEINLLFFKFSKTWEWARITLFEYDIPFERVSSLAQKDGDTLILNIGDSATDRFQGDIRDIGETIYARSTGSSTVEVWSPQFNVPDVPFIRQTFTGINKIVANGGAGDDFINLSGVGSTIEVEIHGGAGNDTILGGAGSDMIYGDEGQDNLYGGGGDDAIIDGGLGDDYLYGGGGDDLVVGGKGQDRLYGDGDDDILDGGLGDDYLEGGTGVNRYVLAGAGSIDEIFDDGTGIVDFTGVDSNVAFFFKNGKFLAGFGERLGRDLNGDGIEDFAHEVRADDPESVNEAIGGSGADTFEVYETASDGVILDGGPGSDTFVVYGADPGDYTVMDVTMRDTGNSWDEDAAFVFGTEAGDDLTVTTEDLRFNFDSAGSQFFRYDPAPVDGGPGGLEFLTVKTFDGADMLDIEGTSISVAVAVFAGEDADTIHVGDPAIGVGLNNIRGRESTGPLFIEAGAGEDTLIVDDSSDGTPTKSPVELGFSQGQDGADSPFQASILTAVGVPTGGHITPYQLSGTAIFTVTVNGDDNEITLPATDTQGNAALADLVADVNLGLAGAGLEEVVEAWATTEGRIELFAVNGTDELEITFVKNDPAGELGFVSGQGPDTSLVAKGVPAGAESFRLDDDATFIVTVNGTDYSVTLPVAGTGKNTKLGDLVNDVNLGLVTSGLEGVVAARATDDGRIELFAVNLSDDMVISSLVGAADQLGFTEDQERVFQASILTADNLPGARGENEYVLGGDAVFTIELNGGESEGGRTQDVILLQSRTEDNQTLADLAQDLNEVFAIPTIGLDDVVEARTNGDKLELAAGELTDDLTIIVPEGDSAEELGFADGQQSNGEGVITAANVPNGTKRYVLDDDISFALTVPSAIIARDSLDSFVIGEEDQDTTFTITVNGTDYEVTLPYDDTADNNSGDPQTDLAALVKDLNRALAHAELSGVLVARSVAKPDSAGRRLALYAANGIDQFSISGGAEALGFDSQGQSYTGGPNVNVTVLKNFTDGSTGPAAELGFSNGQGPSEVLTADESPDGGGDNIFQVSRDAPFTIHVMSALTAGDAPSLVLSNDAVFNIYINDFAHEIKLAESATTGNTELNELVADLNNAFAEPGVDLGMFIQAKATESGQVQIFAVNGTDELGITFYEGNGNAAEELGFTSGQTSTGGYSETLTLLKADTLDNSTIQHLVDDLNGLIASSTLNGIVEAVQSGDKLQLRALNDNDTDLLLITFGGPNRSMAELVADVNFALAKAGLEGVIAARETNDGKLELFAVNEIDEFELDFVDGRLANETVIANEGTPNEKEIDLWRVTGLGIAEGIEFTNFEALDLRLGQGEDLFTLENTIAGSTKLFGGPGDDRIDVLQSPGNDLTVSGGTSDDVINLLGTEATLTTIFGEDLQVQTLQQGTPEDPLDADIIPTDEVQKVTVGHTSGYFTLKFRTVIGEFVFEEETAPIHTGAADYDVEQALEALELIGKDNVEVTKEDGSYLVTFVKQLGETDVAELSTGDDIINIQSIDGVTTVKGGAGSDDLRVNVEVESGEPTPENNIRQHLRLDGESGGDRYLVNLTGSGPPEFLIDVDDGGDADSGADIMTINATDLDDTFLLRAAPDDTAFVAMLNTGVDENGDGIDDIERVNYNRSLEAMVINSFAGDDTFALDDNVAVTTINAGEGDDRFQIGQLFNSRRDSTDVGIAAEDFFATIETTRGYLSNGISEATTINGGAGEDNFVVFHNLAVLTLNGGDDDDSFTIRAFALAGSQDDLRERTDVSGDAGVDLIQYAVNAPVNIDGGDGFDIVKVIGTEFGDDFVITKDGVFGAGLNVNFVGVESLEVDGAEGDDRFFILSTNENILTRIVGGKGSDTFNIAGPKPSVVSNDLLGHSGLIGHSVVSTDPDFDGIEVEGISVNVADDDEPGIVITQSDGYSRVSEGNELTDSYTVVLTRKPEKTVTVTAIAPVPPPEDEGAATIVFTGKPADDAGKDGAAAQVTFDETDWFAPKTITFKAAADEATEGLTFGAINHTVQSEDAAITGEPTIVDGVTFTDETSPFGEENSLVGRVLEITLGPGEGESRIITGNTVDTLTLAEPWDVNAENGVPTTESRYRIRITDSFVGLPDQVEGTTLTDLDANFPNLPGEDNLRGATIEITSGPGVGQSRLIASNTADTLTLFKPWDLGAEPDTTSTYQIKRYDGLAIPTVPVEIIDNEAAEVILTQTGGGIGLIETAASDTFGAVDTYEVSLSRKPKDDVTVTVKIDEQLELVDEFGAPLIDADGQPVTELDLTFSPGEFTDTESPVRTVTVRANDDLITEGFHHGLITHTVSSEDPDFDGIDAPKIVADIADNDDAPGVLITESNGSTNVIESDRTLSIADVVVEIEEIQTVTVNATEGTFTLTFAGETTVSIAYDAGAEVVQTALEGLETIDVGDVAVTREDTADGAVYTVRFKGNLRGKEIPEMTADSTDPNGTIAVATLVDTYGSLGYLLVGQFGDTDHSGKLIRITSGRGEGQTREIITNNSTVILIDQPWNEGNVPDATSKYEIFEPEVVVAGDVTYLSSNFFYYRYQVTYRFLFFRFTRTRVAKVPTTDILRGSFGSRDLAGKIIEITNGPGKGQRRTILSNTATQVVTTPWGTKPTTNSDYRILVESENVLLSGQVADPGENGAFLVGDFGDEVLTGATIDVEATGETNTQSRRILAHTDTVVLVDQDWDTRPQTGDSYRITSGVPVTDTYSVVLTKAPGEGEIVTVRVTPQPTRTSRGQVVTFARQVEVETGKLDDDGNYILEFAGDNWNVPQTVIVSAINDNKVDGGDTKVFPELLDVANDIQGPLFIEGGFIDEFVSDLSTFDPMRLPGETNVTGAPLTINSDERTVTVVARDIANFAPDLSGFSIRFVLGDETIIDKVFTIESNEWNDPQDLDAPVTLTLVDDEQVIPGDVEYYIINRSNPNFFVEEKDQVDALFVHHTDSVADNYGKITDIDQKFNLSGLGMGGLTRIGGENLPGGITFGSLEEVFINLGEGDDDFVIETSFPGAITLNSGAGDDVIDVLSVGGHTFINAGGTSSSETVTDNDTINVSKSEQVAMIQGLLTVTGDVPQATVTTIAKGSPEDGPVPAVDEIQRVDIDATGGTFQLELLLDPISARTADLNFNATEAEVRDALAAALEDAGLVSEGSDPVEVLRDGTSYLITFKGDLGGQDIPLLVAHDRNLSNGLGAHDVLNVDDSNNTDDVVGLLTSSTLAGLGFPGVNEIQTLVIDAEGGEFTLSYNGAETDPLLDYGAAAEDVQAALEGLETIGKGNVAVTKNDDVYVIRFQGQLTSTNVELLQADASKLLDGQNIRGEDGGDVMATVTTRSNDTDLRVRNDMQTLTVDATSGTYTLTVEYRVFDAATNDFVPESRTTDPIPFDADADTVRRALQVAVADSVVEEFKNDISVSKVGNVYVIGFQGKLRKLINEGEAGQGVGFLKADTSLLVGEVAIATRMDGVNYYGFEEVNIDLGSGDEVFNVQGTTAGSGGFAAAGGIAVTNVNLHDGNEQVFVSSNADLDFDSKEGFEFLTGDLDDVNGALNLDVGTGRHKLMISDEAATVGDSNVMITDDNTAVADGMPPESAADRGLDPNAEIFITGLAGQPDMYPEGGISYMADNPSGNFYEGIRIWTGQGDDTVFVDGAHKRDGERTTTILYTGFGSDSVIVDIDVDDGFFVLDTQGAGSMLPQAANVVSGLALLSAENENGPDDDDFIDASASTTPRILFGGLGNDTIIGGSGDDIIFGDFGRVLLYLDDAITDIFGLGGRGDLISSADAVAKLAFTPDTLVPGGLLDDDLRTMGGADTLIGGPGQDVIIGGAAGDIIDGGDNEDLIFGDNVYLDRRGDLFRDFITNPRFRTLTGEQIYGEDANTNDGEVLIDRENQYVNPDDSPDGSPVWANWEITLLDHSDADESASENDFGIDYIAGGADDDMIFGQLGDDTIQGDGSVDGLVKNGIAVSAERNDNGELVIVASFEDSSDGDDYIEGNGGSDVIFGNLGQDDIIGGSSTLFSLGEVIISTLTEGNETTTNEVQTITVNEQVGVFNLSFGGEVTETIYLNADATVVQERLVALSSIDEGNVNVTKDGNVYTVEFQNALGNQNVDQLIGSFPRPDGSDLIFGGAGTVPAEEDDQGNPTYGRNHMGDITVTGHARDADMILGDNGNIYRLVELVDSETGSTEYLEFNYDNYTDELDPEDSIKIIPRAAELIDYSPGGEDYLPNTTGADYHDQIPGFNDIGAADEIHGESGDDFVYGQVGSDILFGEGQDDDLIGGYGNDWISGGTGQDGVLGDDGRIYTSRNVAGDASEFSEPLYGIHKVETDNQSDYKVISTPGDIQYAEINQIGELKKTVNLTPFMLGDPELPQYSNEHDPQDADDIIFGGWGDDFLHGGDGDDAISGAEALPEFYNNPFNPGDVLQYGARRDGEFAAYDEYDPWRKVYVNDLGWVPEPGDPLNEFLLNFDANDMNDEGYQPLDEYSAGTAYAPTMTDGDDVIFGDLGNDWLVGGTGKDHIYGGRGSDLLNADDDHDTVDEANTEPDTHPSYEDFAYGGAGRDVLIANTGGDRLTDWAGEFNSYIVPYAPFGAFTIFRAPQPQLFEFLYDLSKGDGADQTLGFDDARNGEPEGELGLVTQRDPDWREQTGAPDDPQPGNIPSGARDVLRAATFNTGSMAMEAFAVDSGVWEVESGMLKVSAESLGGDAASVFHVPDMLPQYFEIQASITMEKPTGGWKANSYVIFDYYSPTDFKFAGLNASIDKIQIGHRDETGWIVDVQDNMKIKPGEFYNVLVAVNGTTVTVLADNKEYFSHTFEPRVIDGWVYGLNSGMVGFGSDNSRGVYDNIAVQVLPPEITFKGTEEFPDSDAAIGVVPSTGDWQMVGGRYNGSPAADGTAAISLVDLGLGHGFEVASVLEMETTLNTESTAGLIFDYYGPKDFKFAAIDAIAGKAVIGHYTSKSGWVYDATFDIAIEPGVDYDLNLSLKGSTVNLSVKEAKAKNWQAMVGHVYNAVTVDGDFGLLSKDGSSSFDEVTVKTNDPAFRVQDDASALTAAATSTEDPEAQSPLTYAELDPIIAEAIERWADSVGDQVVSAFDDVTFLIADLSGDTLALTVDDTVIIDIDAADHGWFVDLTPEDDLEFIPQNGDGKLEANASSPAYEDMDVLTAVMHELGHVLGFEDLDPDTNPDDLMSATLDTGERYLLGNSGSGQPRESTTNLVAIDLTPDESVAKDSMASLVDENPWLVKYLLNGAEDDTNPNDDIAVVIPKDDPQDGSTVGPSDPVGDPNAKGKGSNK
jgi:Ca2+-binding RTX toxin-like protein